MHTLDWHVHHIGCAGFVTQFEVEAGLRGPRETEGFSNEALRDVDGVGEGGVG